MKSIDPHRIVADIGIILLAVCTLATGIRDVELVRLFWVAAIMFAGGLFTMMLNDPIPERPKE